MPDTKKIGCHHDVRFPKTNYLKTNLLKQIKKISCIEYYYSEFCFIEAICFLIYCKSKYYY